MSSKKYLIVLILKLLESNTDSSNRITQIEIARQISSVYTCDRKTVGRNIKFLQKIGYPIIKTGKGYYMDKKIFSVNEINYILTAVKAYDEIDGINKDELNEKLRKHLNGLKR